MTESLSPAGALDAAQIAELSELVRLNQRASATYAAIAPRLTNIGRRQTLIRFRGEHEGLAAELSTLIRSSGGVPPEATAVGTVAARLLAGGERRLMALICRQARRARAQYVRTAERRDGYPDAFRERLMTAADDVARQCEWAESQLEAMPGLAGAAAARERLAELSALAREHRPSNRALAVGAIALGVGFAVGASIRRGRKG